MDKAGPFAASRPLYLYFSLPVSGAVIGDFTIRWVIDGAESADDLYVTEVASGTYHVSNRPLGLPYLSAAAEDVYLDVVHDSTGYSKLFHFQTSSDADLIKGLILHNADVVPLTYDANGQMLTGQLVIYTDSGGGTALATYNVTATYSGTQLTRLTSRST